MGNPTLDTKNKWLPHEYKGGGKAVRSRTYVPYQVKKQIAARKNTPICARGSAGSVEIVNKDDYFESASLTKVIDLICEGPIEGFSSESGETMTFFSRSRHDNLDFLKAIYLNDTVVLNERDGTFNFRVFDADFRKGETLQESFPEGYGYQGKTVMYGTQLFPANNESAFNEINALTELAKLEGDAAQLQSYANNPSDAALNNPDIKGYAATAVSLGLDFKLDGSTFSGSISPATKRKHSAKFRKKERHLHPIVHTITDPNVEVVSIAIDIHALSQLKVGKRDTKTKPSELNFLIYANNEGAVDLENPPLLEVTREMAESHYRMTRSEGQVDTFFVDVGTHLVNTGNSFLEHELIENDAGGFFVRKMKGLATSDYIFETIIHLPPNPKGLKRVIRTSLLDPDREFKDGTASGGQAAASLHSVTEIVPCRLRHPGSAVIGSMIDARSFSTVPTRKYLLKLLKIRVPSNYLPGTKEYVGNWNGKFKTLRSSVPESYKDTHLQGGLGLTDYKVRDPKSVTQRSDTVKVVHSTSRYGSGSLFFPASSGYGWVEEQEKSLRVRDTYQYVSQSISQGGEDKTDLSPFGTFAQGNFTIEFYMRASEAQIQTVYDIKNKTSHESGGVDGVSKIIIASEENAGLGHGSAVDVGHPGLGDLRIADDLWFAQPGQHPDRTYSYAFLGQLFGGAWRIEIGTKGTTSETNLGLGRLQFRAWRPDALTFVAPWAHEGVPDLTQLLGGNYERIAKVTGTTNVADDEWHHVAISRNGNRLRLFVDGELESASFVYEGIYGFKYVSQSTPEYNIDLGIGSQKTYATPANLYTKGEVQIGGTRTPTSHDGKYGTSYCGYLDEIMISDAAKYTDKSFDAFPDHLDSLMRNDFFTTFYINGDGENVDSTHIVDRAEAVVRSGSSATKADKDIEYDQARLQWTDNPAWILYDLVTNKRYGLGKYGIDAELIDKWSLYEIAKYCDEKVKTGYAPKFSAKEFQVVDSLWGDRINAGTAYVKINGFSNQREFEEEFPEFSTIALYDLNDDAEPAHRRITYLRASDSTGSAMTSEKYLKEEGKEEQLISYQNASDKDSAGYAVIKIQRLISVDEALLVEPELVNYLQVKKTPRGNSNNLIERRASEKHLILGLMDNAAGSELNVTKYFNRDVPINQTSTSGIAATEFDKSFDILEPRFSANLFITTQVDAYKLLNDIASIFRGITYFANGKISAFFDKKRDPVFNFTNANVKDGAFVYSGSSKSERYTTCVVRYVDKYEQYKPKTEYIEDPDGVIKYGILEKELVAFGCTSRSQAKRLGKWFLFTSQYETETVEFSAGKECGYLRPGDVVKVMDKTRTQKRFGGRVVDFINGELKVKLDLNLSEDYIGEQIHITTIRDFEFSDSLDEKTDRMVISGVGTAAGEGWLDDASTPEIYHPKVTDEEISNIRRSQITTYRIKSVEADTSLVPVENRIVELESLDGGPPLDFGKIKIGSIFILNQKSTDVKIQENVFKVVNVSQVNDLEYKVQALQYAESKFDLSDNKVNSKINFVHSKTPIEYSRPAKPIGVPRVNVVSLKGGLQRELQISWEEVKPTPEKYRIEVGMKNAAQGYIRDVAAALEEDPTTIHRWAMTVSAKHEDGSIANTSVAINIGDYTGEIDIAIYSIDENGNLDLIYY